MLWVAAFSISAYGSSNARASHKPFNPLLGETFECIREDKGFKYVAEQVGPHHQCCFILENVQSEIV